MDMSLVKFVAWIIATVLVHVVVNMKTWQRIVTGVLLTILLTEVASWWGWIGVAALLGSVVFLFGVTVSVGVLLLTLATKEIFFSP